MDGIKRCNLEPTQPSLSFPLDATFSICVKESSAPFSSPLFLSLSYYFPSTVTATSFSSSSCWLTDEEVEAPFGLPPSFQALASFIAVPQREKESYRLWNPAMDMCLEYLEIDRVKHVKYDLRGQKIRDHPKGKVNGGPGHLGVNRVGSWDPNEEERQRDGVAHIGASGGWRWCQEGRLAWVDREGREVGVLGWDPAERRWALRGNQDGQEVGRERGTEERTARKKEEKEPQFLVELSLHRHEWMGKTMGQRGALGRGVVALIPGLHQSRHLGGVGPPLHVPALHWTYSLLSYDILQATIFKGRSRLSVPRPCDACVTATVVTRYLPLSLPPAFPPAFPLIRPHITFALFPS